MSVTKFEIPEGELISQVDVNSERLTQNPSRCSCIECDSLDCFTKRNKAIKDRCQCGICRDLRTCSTLPKKESREKRTELETATKKVIREVVTRETIESLKRVTETMYEFGNNNDNFRISLTGQTRVSNNKVLSKPSQISDNKECCKQSSVCPSKKKNEKEHSKENSISQCHISDKRECCKQRPIAQIPSRNVSQSLKEGNAATKLSAQVMNVPYEELHESVPSSQELIDQNPLSKLNIFKRIKEIYEACSCKVCECISNKSQLARYPCDLRDDFCKCKPCDCKDCVKARKTIEEKIKRVPHSGCPCIRCDRKDCRGIVKDPCEPQVCECDSTDNIQNLKNLSKTCKCEPCQCINCRLLNNRTPKSVKLGKVDEIIQSETCKCSPCECIKCKQIYNRTNPTVMCTTSTEISQYRNYCRCTNCHRERCQSGEIETCQCERYNRTMRKPFENNYNDYDIRTVIVDNNGPFDKQKQDSFENDNTVALFASLKNNYPSNSCNTRICRCTECECIVCTARDDSTRKERNHLRPNVMSVHNTIKVPAPIRNACKCVPCECEVCSKKDESDSIVFASNCKCDVCDCLHCDKSSLATTSFTAASFTPHDVKRSHHSKPIKSIEINKNCQCSHCDCKNCKKLFSCSSSVKFYSNGKSLEKKTSRRVRKVMLITPSTSESQIKSQKSYARSVSSTALSPKYSVEGVFRQDLSTCHAIPHSNYAPMCQLSKTNKDEVCQLYRNNRDCNVICDNDDGAEIFLNLNNPALETESFKSILNEFCDLSQAANEVCSHNEYGQNESQYHNFNIIHESPVNITSKDSDELTPIFWACNKSSYPTRFSRNMTITCKSTKSSLKEDLTQCTESKPVNVNIKSIEKEETNQNLNYDKSNYGETSKELHYCENYNYSCDGVLHQNSHDNNYSYNAVINNSDPQNEKSNINNSEVSIDYERATRVLWDAKAFSSKLIKMLDSFETANRQFESASQKFKVLHQSLLYINESETNENHITNRDTAPKYTGEETFEKIAEAQYKNDCDIYKNPKNENQAEREYEQISSKPQDTNDSLQCTKDLIMSINYELTDDKIMIKAEKTNLQQKEIDTMPVIDCNIQLEPNTIKKSVDATLSKSFQILSRGEYPQSEVSDSKKINTNQTALDILSDKEPTLDNVSNTIRKRALFSVMSKLDSVFGNSTAVDTDTLIDDKEKNPTALSKKRDGECWKLLKKNLYLNASPKYKKAIFESSALEIDMKEAVQAISLQVAGHENITDVVRKPNEALANLQTEVTNLLNMPILQTHSKYKHDTDPGGSLYPKSKLDLELNTMTSAASSQSYDGMIKREDKEVHYNDIAEANKASCDELKASFVGLRRVSDHTVLVKWDVPKRIKDVQGYELLVDGRAVQQIFSPARSMAVVTCLPHAARVLLTIRTIAAADCGRPPTTSIVYRPRK